jgi:perosamine synthetase
MSSPDITAIERTAIDAVMQTPFLSMGPQIEAFERAFTHFTGSSHAIGVNSGTAGLHLCVRAAGIEPGDLFLTTPFSFVASTNAGLYERAIPVFVDVDPHTGNIDIEEARQAMLDLEVGGQAARRWLPRQGIEGCTGRLKVIISVDVFGQPADMDPLVTAARNCRALVIEDACEALGAEYKGRKAGTLGDFGVFAFYPNKQITTGEGGMIITNNGNAAEFMRALRNQGRAVGDTWLSHTHLGYNYRLDELSAALGVAQMTRLEELLARREKVAGWYHERLPEIPGFQPPYQADTTSRASWFVYVIQLADTIERAALAERLKQRGIPVRPYFSPIHLQKYMVERFGYLAGDYPVTEDLGRRSLALPFSSMMSEDQVDAVCQALAACL